MAQKAVELDQEIFSCSICLNLLKDPVTTPCGHSYCMNCIQSFWDREDVKEIHSCPQCRQVFTQRPVLFKNTMLALLVEELKKPGSQTAEDYFAEPDDVACDFCTGRKLKAIKSCLVCMVSYCCKHLQPHYESPAFEKHKLVEPSKKLQENICSLHNEVMKMFCRTDQQCICYLCPVDGHKDHDTVSAAAERTERERELRKIQQNVQKRIQDREKDMKVLQEKEEAIDHSAEKTMRDTENIFTEAIRLLEERHSDVKQQVRSQQGAEVSRVRELQEKLGKEIIELKRRDAELNKLTHTEDHEFLQNYLTLSHLTESKDSSNIKICPLTYFEEMTAAVSRVQQKLQSVLSKDWMNISVPVTDVDVLLPLPEPKTRADYLKYLCEITLDPNITHPAIALSEGNRRATLKERPLPYYSHPDRFIHCYQALSREGLIGCCYWEVTKRARLFVGVAYKTMSRAAGECIFGFNSHSWALKCERESYEFYHNKVQIPVSGPRSSRIGVYLDHRAGILEFYSVTQTMSLLHRVQTTFTQPLYAGIRFYYNYGDIAEFNEFK